MRIHKRLPIAISSWGWKDSPDWSEIQKAVDRINKDSFKDGIYFYDIETGCDEYAVLICGHKINDEVASEWYFEQHTDEFQDL